MRQLVYTIFISNNLTRFTSCEEKFGKTSEVSNYCENDSVQNSLSFLMSILTAARVKNNYIQT